jgi:peptidoglycan hydrolase CwlO-like protein
MRKIDKILNIKKVNQLNEQLYREQKENEEPKIIGQEGIFKRISELTQQRDRLKTEQNQIAKKIKELNLEIKKWENEISPNQTTLF